MTRRARFLIFVIFGILSLLPLLWFEKNVGIFGADLGWLGLDREANFFEHVWTWKNQVAFGLDNASLVPPTITFNLFLWFTAKLGISFITAEKILFVGIMALLNFSAGWLLWQLTPRDSQRARTAGMIAAMVFATFNFTTLIWWHNLIIGLVVSFATGMLVLGWVIRGLREPQKWRSTLGGLGVTSLLVSVFGMNPPAVLGLVVLPSGVWIGLWLLFQKFRWSAIQTAVHVGVGGLVVSLLLNAWWILPLAAQVQTTELQPEFASNVDTTLERNTEHLSIPNLLRLGGYWQLYADNIDGTPYFHFAESYAHPSTGFAVLGFLAVGLGLLGFLRFRKKDERLTVVAVLLIGLIGLFFGKGPHTPWGEIYLWLTNHIPGFWIFRSPDYKIFPNFTLAVSMGFGLGVASLTSWLSHFSSWPGKFLMIFLVAVACVPVILYGRPIADGSVMEPSYYLPSTFPEYEQARQWMKENAEDAKIFILPQERNSYLQYTNGYEGVDYVYNVIPTQAGGIGGGPALQHALIRWIHLQIFRGRSISAETWRILGVRYVLQRNDVNWETYPKHLFMSSPEQISQVLTDSGLTEKISFGDWDIYEVPDLSITQNVRVFRDLAWIGGPISTWGQLERDYSEWAKNSFVFFADLDPAKTPVTPKPDSLVYIKMPMTSRKHLKEIRGWIYEDKEIEDGQVSTSLDYAEDNFLRYQLFIPRDDEYHVRMKMRYDRNQGTLQWRVDNGEWRSAVTPVAVPQTPFDFREADLGTLSLTEGDHTFEWRNVSSGHGNSYQTLEYLLLESDGVLSPEPPISATNIQDLSPVEYHFDVNADSPAYVHFPQSYQPRWDVEGVESQQVVSFGYANGWMIPSYTGEIRLEYASQRLMLWGVWIAGLTALVMIVIILYDQIRFLIKRLWQRMS